MSENEKCACGHEAKHHDGYGCVFCEEAHAYVPAPAPSERCAECYSAVPGEHRKGCKSAICPICTVGSLRPGEKECGVCRDGLPTMPLVSEPEECMDGSCCGHLEISEWQKARADTAETEVGRLRAERDQAREQWNRWQRTAPAPTCACGHDRSEHFHGMGRWNCGIEGCGCNDFAPAPAPSERCANRRQRQYRVTWERAEGIKKSRTFCSRAAADRRVAILSSPEPWRVWNPKAEPGDYFCCSGYECSCEGITMKAETEAKRAKLPTLLSVRVDERSVEYGPWEAS